MVKHDPFGLLPASEPLPVSAAWRSSPWSSASPSTSSTRSTPRSSRQSSVGLNFRRNATSPQSRNPGRANCMSAWPKASPSRHRPSEQGHSVAGSSEAQEPVQNGSSTAFARKYGSLNGSKISGQKNHRFRRWFFCPIKPAVANNPGEAIRRQDQCFAQPPKAD